MADRTKIINIHSNVEGKLPEASVLEYGEIAVNYNEKSPKISFKNNKDNIVTISDDNYFIKIIEENEEVTANALNNLNNSIKDIEEQIDGARYFTEEKEKTIAAAISEVGEIITHITYENLVELKNKGELIPGKQYRIIDYSTFTAQENTISAGHDFDIIVIADSENTLNENARAIQREYDTYFSNSNLSAWELKYTIVNDNKKYAWAEEKKGKGVIYYMKDEFNNEAPYDFKNILFDYSALGSYGYYGGESNTTETNEDSLILYTFTLSNNNTIIDYSMNGDNLMKCKNNVIKENIVNGVCILNFNVFINTSLGSICQNNILNINCYSNTFGNCCYNNTFGNGCYGNTFGNDCYSNTFGDYCTDNTFGNDCYNNTFGNDCSSNTFGNNCSSNTFGNDCQYNTFGDYCTDNTFGNYYGINTFGNECYDNTFGNQCQKITFGNHCYINTFGNYCENNTFGNDCYGNTFGNECDNNTFGNYFIGSTLGEYIRYVDIVDDSATDSSSVKYVKILNGTQGTYENKLHIPFTKLSDTDKYCQYAGLNSKGELKVWCFADMFE